MNTTTRQLSADETEALGLDSTGRDGDPRFPYTTDAAEYQAALKLAPADRPWFLETGRARHAFPELKAAEAKVLEDVRRSYTPRDMSDEEALEYAADTDRRHMDDADGLEDLYLAYVRVMDAQYPDLRSAKAYGVGTWTA